MANKHALSNSVHYRAEKGPLRIRALVLYMDNSVLLENMLLVKFMRNYIRDVSGVFSISSLVRISMTSFSAFSYLLFIDSTNVN